MNLVAIGKAILNLFAAPVGRVPAAATTTLGQAAP